MINMHDLLLCHNYYALDLQWYPMVYTHPPCGNPVDNFWLGWYPVENLWKTWGRGGRRGGEIVTVSARIQKKPKIEQK